ncbi:MAG TPA: DUF1513 domain-containing protein [Methylibium sp.]|uniref:DUF1513 domain-containing protein n=1 Tax=Methylibium sp. TaxID=2067992 RepID=UPI002DB7928B|nr:DUF1513 domain-containing protein [Methylibium sp.]HEU4457580.1 DUF1513 domain-containing protein [Methylibium sp.]
MRTAIERQARRRLLKAALGLAAGCGVRPAFARPSAVLAAAWTRTGAGPVDRVGLLGIGAARIGVLAAVDLPGRAHGLLALPDGALLAVARRPGDWLLHWDARSGAARWCWIEPDRAFTGHALLSRDGRTLFTGETDLATGAGLVGVRDASSLDKRAEWPSGGRDPHMLTLDPEGRLLVANGGIATRPETGRRKLGEAPMDASLVRLDPRDGRPLGRWQLDDDRLSIRHLAWSRDAAGRPLLGIALQAEHADATARDGAPVLALFDGDDLRCADAGAALGGYGGDIAGLAAGFAVSCPRAPAGAGVAGREAPGDAAGRGMLGNAAGRVVRWDAAGRRVGEVGWPQVCALAPDGAALWCGGAAEAGALEPDGGPRWPVPEALRLDNHWLRLA